MLILLDLGGVLLELTGISTMMEWTQLSEDEVWTRWLTSPTVSAFEKGDLPREEFAKGVVREFDLPLDHEDFLAHFKTWIKGYYPCVEDTMIELKQRHTLGCLSNFNEVHLEILKDDLKLDKYFEYPFFSFQLGAVKPDLEIFEKVIESVPFKKEDILFLDDNKMNVVAGNKAGIKSYLVPRGQFNRTVRELGL